MRALSAAHTGRVRIAVLLTRSSVVFTLKGNDRDTALQEKGWALTPIHEI